MTGLLDSTANPQVRQKAAECLMPLAFPTEAKEIAVKSGTILKLGTLAPPILRILVLAIGAASALLAS